MCAARAIGWFTPTPSRPPDRRVSTAGQENYQRTLARAVDALRIGADAVCDAMALNRGVPRLNPMTGGYTWDGDYVWDSWADFQWAGFLAGRLWLLHVLTKEQRYGDAAMQICERIGPVLARHPTVFSSTGIDMYYALTLGYQVTRRDALRQWAFAGGDNFANIFDRKAKAFLQIAGADRIVIDTGLNLPSMLWAAQFEPERAALAYRHLDTVLEIGLIRADGRININASVLRNFAVTERTQLQFRGEFFNLPNHPNFGNPAHQFEGAGFGVVNSARPGRQVQLGLRLTY